VDSVGLDGSHSPIRNSHAMFWKDARSIANVSAALSAIAQPGLGTRCPQDAIHSMSTTRGRKQASNFARLKTQSASHETSVTSCGILLQPLESSLFTDEVLIVPLDVSRLSQPTPEDLRVT
jgi:hypothetical protein